MAKEKGSGIQQAAGLIRYFDEEFGRCHSNSKGAIYFACVSFSVVVYLAQFGVWSWMRETLGF